MFLKPVQGRIMLRLVAWLCRYAPFAKRSRSHDLESAPLRYRDLEPRGGTAEPATSGRERRDATGCVCLSAGWLVPAPKSLTADCTSFCTPCAAERVKDGRWRIGPTNTVRAVHHQDAYREFFHLSDCAKVTERWTESFAQSELLHEAPASRRYLE